MCTPSKKTSVLDCLLISYALCSGHMLLKVVCIESAKQGRFEQRHCQSLSISAIKFLDCLLVSYPDDLLCSGQVLLQIVCAESAKHPNSTRPETGYFPHQTGTSRRSSPTKVGPAGAHPGHQTGTSSLGTSPTKESPWTLSPTKMKKVFFSALKQKQKNPWRSLYQVV